MNPAAPLWTLYLTRDLTLARPARPPAWGLRASAFRAAAKGVRGWLVLRPRGGVLPVSRIYVERDWPAGLARPPAGAALPARARLEGQTLELTRGRGPAHLSLHLAVDLGWPGAAPRPGPAGPLVVGVSLTPGEVQAEAAAGLALVWGRLGVQVRWVDDQGRVCWREGWAPWQTVVSLPGLGAGDRVEARTAPGEAHWRWQPAAGCLAIDAWARLYLRGLAAVERPMGGERWLVQRVVGEAAVSVAAACTLALP